MVKPTSLSGNHNVTSASPATSLSWSRLPLWLPGSLPTGEVSVTPVCPGASGRPSLAQPRRTPTGRPWSCQRMVWDWCVDGGEVRRGDRIRDGQLVRYIQGGRPARQQGQWESELSLHQVNLLSCFRCYRSPSSLSDPAEEERERGEGVVHCSGSQSTGTTVTLERAREGGRRLPG